MRALISGIVGLGLGGMCLISNVLKGGPQGQGAYYVGQVTGLIMGIVFFVAGIFYLITGISELQANAPPKKRRPRKRRDDSFDENRPRKRRRPQRDDDDD